MFDSSTDVVGWKAWYEGDAFYSSARDAWDDLPATGVLVIVLYFGGVLRRIMSGTEYYTSDGSRFNHQHAEPNWGVVKRAPTIIIPQDEYDEVYAKAMLDFTIP